MHVTVRAEVPFLLIRFIFAYKKFILKVAHSNCKVDKNWCMLYNPHGLKDSKLIVRSTFQNNRANEVQWPVFLLNMT